MASDRTAITVSILSFLLIFSGISLLIFSVGLFSRAASIPGIKDENISSGKKNLLIGSVLIIGGVVLYKSF